MPTIIARGLAEFDVGARALDPAGAWDEQAPSLLVAANGDKCSRAAIRVAAAIAPPGAHIRVLAVNDASVVTHSIPLVGAAARTLVTLAGDSLREAVQDQVAGAGCDWPVSVVEGDPATAICRAASSEPTWLIMLGLNEHGLLDRALLRETSLRVLRHAHAPVLAVVPWAVGRPRVIVAGVDFSDTSIRAARFAAMLAAPDTTLLLTHVLTPVHAPAWRYRGLARPHRGTPYRAHRARRA